MKRTLLLCIVCFLAYYPHLLFGQEIYLKGKVVHKDTETPITKASIYLDGIISKQLPTDENGLFTTSLPKGRYIITIKSSNYRILTDTIDIQSNHQKLIQFSLQPSYEEIEEITVTGKKIEDRTKNIQSGTESLNATELEKIPVFLGEKDIIKTIQLKPGVASAGEGISGFYVRGGSTDQNLILLNEMQIYNAAHLMGFFSVFNGDAIEQANLYKGTQPSVYGGRLSSVLDVQNVKARTDHWDFKGGIGLIASRIMANGPIIKNKLGINISARRTYADVFTKLSSDQNIKSAILNFYDLNGNMIFRPSEQNSYKLSFYNGRDHFGTEKGFGISWGNSNASLNWEKKFRNKTTQSNTYFTYNNFQYNIRIGSETSKKLIINSSIKNIQFKEIFDYQLSKKQSLKFGIEINVLRLQPQQVDNPFSDLPSKETSPKKGLENAIFVGDEIKNLGKFKFNIGVRLSSYSVLGGQKTDIYPIYDSKSNVKSIDLSGKFLGKTYFNLEPRIGINYDINNLSAVKFFYGRNTQNVHILNNIAASTPTDVYLISNYNIKPEISDQASLGYFYTLPNKKYELSAEIFYKKLQNQIDYSALIDINSNSFNDSYLRYGIGRAYGLELYVGKKIGKFTGWTSYTYSRSERLTESINNNQYYSAKQDRPHNISMVAMYDINKRLNVALSWIYITGIPTTYPVGTYQIDKYNLNYYEGRNQSRFPDYHRMDFSLNWKSKNFGKKRFYSEWNLSIYNLYNQYNAYYITLTSDQNNKPVFEQTALFGIVPSATYNFRF